MWWSQDGLFERTAGSLEIWFLVLTWLLVTLDTSDQSGSRFPQRLSDLKQQPFYYILWFYTEIQPVLGWVVFSCQTVWSKAAYSCFSDLGRDVWRLVSVGAVHQSGYMWPLQHGGLRVVGLITWQLRAQRLVFQRTRQKPHGLLWLSLWSHKHHFHHTLLGTVQAGPDSRGEDRASTTYWEGFQRIDGRPYFKVAIVPFPGWKSVFNCDKTCYFKFSLLELLTRWKSHPYTPGGSADVQNEHPILHSFFLAHSFVVFAYVFDFFLRLLCVRTAS